MKVSSIHDVCAAGVLACGLVLGGCGDESTASPWTAQLGVARDSTTVAGRASAAAGVAGVPADGSLKPALGGVSGAASAERVAAGSGGAVRVSGSAGAVSGSAGAVSGGAGTGSAGTNSARLPLAGASGSVGVAGSSALADSGGASGRASLPQQPAAAGSAGDSAAAPTFAEVFSLLQRDCDACHALNAGGLNTKTLDSAYTSLVNADSEACPGFKRVEPGNAVRSALYLAITGIGAGACNPPTMPLGAVGGWDEAKTDVVRDWILAGAKR